MKARESVLSSDALGDVSQITPVIQPGMSDSASLDNVLEFLVMSGLSLPQAMAIMVPESFNDKNPISEDLKAFYEYHSIIMEPWDGPAALLFSDGRYAGGMLDRNGLRPARYAITKNDTMVVASEVGVLDFDPSDVVEKGCLQPGKILLVDTKEGRIYRDEEIKDLLASEHPYRKWLNSNRIQLEKLRSGRKVENSVSDLLRKELGFGFNEEDIENVIVPPAVNSASLVLGITVSTITLLNELAIPEAMPPSYSPELFFVPISHGKNLSFTNGTIYLDIKPTAIGMPAATLTPNHTLPIPLIILPINDLESSTFSAALSEKVSTKEPSFVLIPFIESKNDFFSAVFSASSLEPFFGASFSSDSFSIGSSPSSA